MEGSLFVELKKSYKSFAIVGKILIVAALASPIVIEYLIRAGFSLSDGPPPADIAATLRYAFLGVVLLDAALAASIKSRMLSGKMPIQASPGQKANMPEPVTRLRSATAIGYAFSASALIFGIILFIIGLNRLDFYIFLVISLILFAINYPRYEQWEEYAKKEDVAGLNEAAVR